jgi:hypothetical protein
VRRPHDVSKREPVTMIMPIVDQHQLGLRPLIRL